MADIYADDFEDGDIAEYSGEKSYFSVSTDTVFDGSYSLYASKGSGSGPTITNTGKSVSQGDTIHHRTYFDGDGNYDSSFYIGVQSETGSGNVSGYQIVLKEYESRLIIRRYDNGNDTELTSTSANIPFDQWIHVEIDWGTDGSITARLYNSSGSQFESVSTTDGTYTSGGIGYGIYFADVYFDGLQISAPSSPSNVSATVDANDQITLNWDAPSDWGGREGGYRIQMERDGGDWDYPSGASNTVGSGTTSVTVTPNSDNPYDTQVGIDSSFRFRVRAENSAGNSGWSYSSWVYTEPIPPHDPSVSRPDGTTVEFDWVDKSNINEGVEIESRKDTGDGYGNWNTLDVDAARSPNSYTLDPNARYQFRLRGRRYGDSGILRGNWVYADYGNDGNVYFEDDFESGLSAWNTANMADSGSGITSRSIGDAGISGPDQGSNYVELRSTDYIYKEISDLSNESNVIVKCAMAAGSMDSSSEVARLRWHDGSTWRSLREIGWENNKQGWVEVVALVPDEWLSTTNFIQLQCDMSGSGDYAAWDRVVVSDLLHEYTLPASPSGLSLSTPSGGEITGTWTDNASLEDQYELHYKQSSESSFTNGQTLGPNTTTGTITDLVGGEQYDVKTRAVRTQYRHGSEGNSWYQDSGAQSITVSRYTISESGVFPDVTTKPLVSEFGRSGVGVSLTATSANPLVDDRGVVTDSPIIASTPTPYAIEVALASERDVRSLTDTTILVETYARATDGTITETSADVLLIPIPPIPRMGLDIDTDDAAMRHGTSFDQ